MSRSELNKSLVRTALDARRHAYAPYSNFAVGAAVATTDGAIHAGCNVENASYGLTVCAERVAIWNAVSHGVQAFEAMAIATDGGYAPCGACLQVMAEFAADLALLLVDAKTDRTVAVRLNELLPMRFDLRNQQPRESVTISAGNEWLPGLLMLGDRFGIVPIRR